MDNPGRKLKKIKVKNKTHKNKHIINNKSTTIPQFIPAYN